ncbi:MAG: hypothetical protein Q4G36_11835 [Paracoccus sp. (in: a-proteobacteria)]|nr:hypothetical protein [Paracoccus sp. (in: a-proteobacteria)]
MRDRRRRAVAAIGVAMVCAGVLAASAGASGARIASLMLFIAACGLLALRQISRS